MNGNDTNARLRQSADHTQVVQELVGNYALAKGVESGLERARDALARQLSEARAETHEAWRALDRAVAAESSSEWEAE